MAKKKNEIYLLEHNVLKFKVSNGQGGFPSFLARSLNCCKTKLLRVGKT